MVLQDQSLVKTALCQPDIVCSGHQPFVYNSFHSKSIGNDSFRFKVVVFALPLDARRPGQAAVKHRQQDENRCLVVCVVHNKNNRTFVSAQIRVKEQLDSRQLIVPIYTPITIYMNAMKFTVLSKGVHWMSLVSRWSLTAYPFSADSRVPKSTYPTYLLLN